MIQIKWIEMNIKRENRETEMFKNYVIFFTTLEFLKTYWVYDCDNCNVDDVTLLWPSLSVSSLESTLNNQKSTQFVIDEK
jgi:hypothetical protein